jgi:hypothetical protein
MIYPWYDEDRWLRERFTGKKSKGLQLIREYAPGPSMVYFRHSYASFRINGLEYARLHRNGHLRYGIKYAPLKISSITPRQLVSALVDMFNLLAEHGGKTEPVVKWVSSNFSGDVAHFLRHVSLHHQAEHWLESKLLNDPSIICNSFGQVRSQVVLAHVSEEPKGFIDLLTLDTRKRLVWIVELKAVKTTRSAISQANAYAHWIHKNMSEILDESFGYFSGVKNPSVYRPAVAFVAQSFSSNFDHYTEHELPRYFVKKVQINSGWRNGIKVESIQDFRPGTTIRTPDGNGENGSDSNTNANRKEKEPKMKESKRRWLMDPLINRIIEKAQKYNLKTRESPDPGTLEYINLRWRSASGNVATQIHKHLSWPNGCALIIGNADEDCPETKFKRIEDFTQLSGDHGSNKPWLRAEGKNFGHRKPAKAFFVPNSMLKETDNSATWKEVEDLLRYAADRTAGGK